MDFLLLLLLMLSFCCAGENRLFNGTYRDQNRILDLDLAAVSRRVDPRFLSVTIDASLAAKEQFMLLLRSQKIRTLARALSPAYLRFGGTEQDFMEFSPQRQQLDSGESCSVRLPRQLEQRLIEDWSQQQLVLAEEEQQNKFSFTEVTVDLLQSFSRCSGLDLIFGLNALLRTADNTWNSSNARSLLQYCQSRRYNMSWELGNEPNSYEKKAGVRVDGYQLGLDFAHLRKVMSEWEWYRDAGLYGPDVGQPRNHRADLLGSFLQSGADSIDACTWHHYYVNGRDTSLEDFLDPEVLDSLALKTKEVLETLRQASPGKSVWLGETSSAYGGGALGLSDTFVSGFMWLDKLGLGASLGLDVVMRQVLFGSGSYHMIDKNLEPLPDFWLSVLYKRLVGPEVLTVRFVSNCGRSKRVRLYLHCANRKSYSSGAVVLMFLNLSRKPQTISLPDLVSSSAVDAFVLQSSQAGEEGLKSSSVLLNGVLVKMVDDETLPELAAARFPPTQHLELPAYSLGFFVFLEARAPACR